MAIQDDISAFFDSLVEVPSNIGEAGRRAMRSGEEGAQLYADIMYGRPVYGLTERDRRRVMRDFGMLGSNPEMSLEEEMAQDPTLGQRVIDIVNSYRDTYPEVTAGPEIDYNQRPDTSRVMPRPRPAVPVTPIAPPVVPTESTPRSPEPYVPIEGVTNRAPNTGLGTGLVSANVPGAVPRAIAASQGQPTDQQLTETIANIAAVDPERAREIQAGVNDAALASMMAATMLPAAPSAAAAAVPATRGLAGLLQRVFGIVPKYTPQAAGRSGQYANTPAALAPRTKMMRDPATGRMIGARNYGPQQVQPGYPIGANTRFQPKSEYQRLMEEYIRSGKGYYADGGRLRDGIMGVYDRM